MTESYTRLTRGGMSLAALLTVGLMSGGCAFRTQTTGMAVDYNDFIASTTNRQTVLNVLRASHREPMHFTSFSEVVGTVRGTGALGVNVAANGDGGGLTRTGTTVANTGAAGVATGGSTTAQVADAAVRGATNVTPSVSLQVATGTDFKIAANATDEFYKGILNPIASGTIVNYLRQGFPADLLSHLVVGRLEYSVAITPPGGKPSDAQVTYLLTIDNHPNVAADIGRFTSAIRCRQLDYAASRTPRREIEAESLKDLGTLTVDQLARVASRRQTDGRLTYALTIPERNDFTLAMSESRTGHCEMIRAELDKAIRALPSGIAIQPQTPASVAKAAADLTPRIGKLELRSGDDREREDGGRDRIAATKVQLESKGYFDRYLQPGYHGDLVIDITLRSVEGVIYYLGEYIRSAEAPVLLKRDDDRDAYDLPILVVKPAGSVRAADRFAQVDYRGTSYAVPLSGEALGTEAGRSSQTIGLVQQLLNLNRSAKDLPSTPLVRVYN